MHLVILGAKISCSFCKFIKLANVNIQYYLYFISLVMLKTQVLIQFLDHLTLLLICQCFY